MGLNQETINLRDYYYMLYPETLEDDEYICVVGIKEKAVTEFYLKSYQEFASLVNDKKYIFNLYANLATVRGKGRDKTHQYRRKTIFLDYDRKDYKGSLDFKKAINLIKSKFPSLYYCYTVDSGGGFHFYFITEETHDIDLITELNKHIALVTGADVKAAISTQIARIPSSINLKDPTNTKIVNTIRNDFDIARPFALNTLKRIVSKVKPTKEGEPVESETRTFNKTNLPYYCVQNMLAVGTEKSKRNFCLGRITNYLRDIQKCTESAALKIVYEFNDKCRPPKPKKELESEFYYYWNGNYWLLGCDIKDPVKMAILEEYCDKYACKTVLQYEESFTIEDGSHMKIDNDYFKPKSLKSLDGNHFLIITILLESDNGLTIPQLEKRLISTITKKLCMKKDDLYSLVNDLVDLGIVYSKFVGRTKHLTIKELNNHCRGYTQVSVAARILLINKIINKNDFMVYLVLVHRCRQGETCTQEKLAEIIGVDIRTVRNCIGRLREAYVIDTVSQPTERGTYYNRYILKI